MTPLYVLSVRHASVTYGATCPSHCTITARRKDQGLYSKHQIPFMPSAAQYIIKLSSFLKSVSKYACLHIVSSLAYIQT